MSDKAIRIEDLSKLYHIGEHQGSYKTLRETIVNAFSAPVQHLCSKSQSPIRNPQSNFIWALKNISFEVKRGEVVGIIGRNGAGKTTLLKILSRITEPTEGWAEIQGRVGSLLEVGTGFHPELTGRENIYLNGAILGMSKTELNNKFDEIVAFAEIGKFIETPVKRYSSGMYVRLAFAVAAHLQPEILLVDEVLAVGDIEFQKKCIGKMEDIASEGRTVIVVSHTMSTIKALCSKAILLDCGMMKASGPVNDVVADYLGANQVDSAEKIVSDEDHLTGIKQIRVKRIRLLNSVTNSFSVYWQQPISVSLEVEVIERVEEVAFGASIRTLDGADIFTVHHDQHGTHPLWSFEPGEYIIQFTLQNNLRPGLYKLHVGADQAHIVFKKILAIDDAVTLEILDHTERGLTTLPSLAGVVNGSATWESPLRVK